MVIKFWLCQYRMKHDPKIVRLMMVSEDEVDQAKGDSEFDGDLGHWFIGPNVVSRSFESVGNAVIDVSTKFAFPSIWKDGGM